VTGANGAGKTNLLEALHVGTQGFSPRTRADVQLIRFGEQAARVRLNGVRGAVQTELEVTLRVGEGKQARLNGARLTAAEQLRHEVSTLVFTPDRLAIVKGGPATRRAYFDRSLGRLIPARVSVPAEYGAAVGQRNAALRRIAGGSSDRDALAPWTAQVASLGAALVATRGDVLDLLTGPFAAVADELGLSDARLVYDAESPTVEQLERVLPRDLERGTTSVGPHLDEIGIFSGERDLRAFGSQGEQRLAVLSLLLAEAELIGERRGVQPLLLLDDVLSELDPGRRSVLVRHVEGGGQTMITTTTRDALPAEPAQLLEVTPGEVRAA
jgi:DNA replication and repair protein RecF